MKRAQASRYCKQSAYVFNERKGLSVKSPEIELTGMTTLQALGALVSYAPKYALIRYQCSFVTALHFKWNSQSIAP